MAYNITDFDGGIIPISSGYPFGNVKDDPAGTRFNSKASADIWQFFQKIANMAGLSLSGTPDNATNGFQFVQALSKLINQESSGMAAAFGAAGLTPVVMSGVVFAMGGSTYTVTAGWFFYNGKYVYTAGTLTPRTNPGGGQVVLFTIADADGIPTATISNAATVTDATHFPVSLLTSWADSVGLTKNAPGAWQNVVTFGTHWVAGSITPKCSIDGYGRVYFEGTVKCNLGGSAGLTVCQLPSSSMYPLVNMVRPMSLYDGVSAFVTVSVGISTGGNIVFENVSELPATTNAYLDLSAINYLVL